MSFENESYVGNDQSFNDSFLQICHEIDSTHVESAAQRGNSTGVNEAETVQLNMSFNVVDLEYLDNNTLVTVLPSDYVLETPSNVDYEHNEHAYVDASNLPGPSSDDPDRTIYFREYKQASRSKQRIRTSLSSLNVEQRKDVLSSFLEHQEEVSMAEKISDHLMTYLRTLYTGKNFTEFYKMIRNMFPEYDASINQYISRNVGIRPWLLSRNFRNHLFMKVRGRPSISLAIKQLVIDLFAEHSIPTVDRRNGRDKAKLRSEEYVKLYEDVTIPQDIVIENERNKRGIEMVTTTKRILTITLRKLLEKIHSAGHKFSLGLLVQMKPFFISYASEKEKILCMCILCLNVREVFNSLMAYLKTVEEESVFSSISQYMMKSCTCTWSEVGYYKKECCKGKCRDCTIKIPPLPAAADKKKVVNYFQFEKVVRIYTSKKDGKKKKSKRCEKIEHLVNIKKLHNLIAKLQVKYTYHRYEVYLDKYIWPKIISTASQDNPIFHMDFSENLQFTPKFEPQPAHFNKKQSTLYCTVIHTFKDGEPVTEYVFHFSDDNGHNAGFTFTCIEDLIAFFPDALILRFKSDNCACQYKCRHVFIRYNRLAKKHAKLIIVYYGICGHGKGLVDAMSGFGVKGPLRSAIIQENRFFANSTSMVEYLQRRMEEKPNMHYIEVDDENLAEQRALKDELPIPGSQKLHMIAFHPDGTIVTKDNLCNCDQCNAGKFHQCPIENGHIFQQGEHDDDDEDDINFLYGDEEDEHEVEENELPKETYFDVVETGSFVAVYSHGEDHTHELFSIVKVIERRVAMEDITDDHHHTIRKGESYFFGFYLEKLHEQPKRRTISYKLLEDKEVFILPGQIFFPCVPFRNDLQLKLDDYQFLCDCCI